nr:hypothetical protein [Kibdelosporangium sp. MJ126-NF4]CEL14460.1 hypothetical protein [Kibdelosporangium sp. MJ126-NF4]CTQ88825.1 hypothetical protein [Kibdelosporangium sp. MJ126-NF4]
MKWIHGPNWGDGTARLLHDTLGAAFHHAPEIEEICQAVGLPPKDYAWGQSAALLWPSITRDSFEAGCLEVLVEQVKARKPAVAPALDRVLGAHVMAANWYSVPERHLSLLLGPGCARALLDRAELREHLVDMVLRSYPVLAITGEPGTGKSYSRHLIQHMAGDPALDCEFKIIDLEDDVYDHVDMTTFMTMLCTRLGLAARFDVDTNTEQTRTARELVDIFVGRFAALPPRLRWLFVDGLDRPHVPSGVHVVVAQLAREVEAGQLGETRLIVTGHPGDFAPSVLEVLRHEQLSGLTEAHVRAFFNGLAQHVGTSISDDQVSELVRTVVADAVDLADLKLVGSAASRAAHAHFRPGEAP